MGEGSQRAGSWPCSGGRVFIQDTSPRPGPADAAKRLRHQLFMDSDYSEWDFIDEPFEPDDDVAAAARQDMPRTAPGW